MDVSRRVLSLSLFTLVVLAAGRAPAADVGVPGEPFSLEVHGFVSQGFIKSWDNNYLANSERGSFEFSEVGLNFTKRLTDRLRIGAQLFARDLGPLGNYSAKFDWYYLDYRFFDWLGFRAGRIKIPFGLYNEVNDVDSARVPILLPQSIYPIASRDYLLAQTGVELYGYLPLGRAGALDYRVYFGTIYIDTTSQAGKDPVIVGTIANPYVGGGRLLWETPRDGLRLGGSVQALRLDATEQYSPATSMELVAAGVAPPGFNGTVNLKIPVVLGVASVEYAAHDLLLAAEYSQWRASYLSVAPLTLPSTSARARTSERMYGMASYRLRPWFSPGAYYSLFFPAMDHRTPRDAHQHDFAATLRFDINSFWIVKLEGHYMRGTAGVDPALNDNMLLSQLPDSWVVLLAKTTVFF